MSHDSHPHPHGDGSWIGRSVPRVEDDRLLRGNGRYVDDISLPGAVEAAFLRSPHAHARIDSVDVSAALAAPGVVAVWTGDDVADLPAMLNKEELRTPPGLAELLDPVVRMTPMPLLAADKVLYVGQPVAVVFAENRYLAEDALELVDVRYSPLAVLVDPERSLTPNAPLLHEELPDNTAVTVAARVGDPDAAFARAHAVVSERFEAHRYVASPIETRAISAQVDPYSGRLTVWSGTQTPHRLRDAIAHTLALEPSAVHVIAADVGGGFGQKGILYVEELIVPHAARRIGRPVLWREDRNENLTASSHAREQIHRIELAADSDGLIIAVRDRITVNFGAYNMTGLVVPYNSLCHLLGPYRIPHVDIDVVGVLTNTTFATPYRGAGRPETVFAMERAMDRLAAELGIEPEELRARNLVGPDAMPYATGLVDRSGRPQTYDSGDYPELLRRAVAKADAEGCAHGSAKAPGTESTSASDSPCTSKPPASDRSRPPGSTSPPAAGCASPSGHPPRGRGTAPPWRRSPRTPSGCRSTSSTWSAGTRRPPRSVWAPSPAGPWSTRATPPTGPAGWSARRSSKRRRAVSASTRTASA